MYPYLFAVIPAPGSRTKVRGRIRVALPRLLLCVADQGGTQQCMIPHMAKL